MSLAMTPSRSVKDELAVGGSCAELRCKRCAAFRRTNVSCQSWVDRMPTNAMLSRKPIERGCAHFADELVDRARVEVAGRGDVGRRQRGRHTARRAGARGKTRLSGARYGCFGRLAMCGGQQVLHASRRMCFSRSPLIFSRGGMRAANSTTRWSRNGKRPSTACAIATRSPCDERM